MNAELKAENKPRNVIILWNYLNWGGAQIYLLSIVKHAPENWKFKIVVPIGSPGEIVNLFQKYGADVEYQNVFPSNSPAANITQKLKRQWNRIHSEIVTLRYIRSQNMSDTILHIETAPWQSWLLIKKLSKYTNVFVTMHNSLPPVSNSRSFIWKKRLRYISRIKSFHLFTSNQDTKNSLKGWVTDDFWNRIRVTYTCVDPQEIEYALVSEMTKTNARRKFSVESDKFVVLCVGQFIDRKGRKIFLEAAKRLLESDKRYQFLWLTQSEIGGNDLDLIESFKLGDSFRIVKSETAGDSRIDILNFIKIADAFALPSYVEGLPIALLEAMALGIPSISTNVNAIPEAVKDNKTGLLIEPGNSLNLADAIKRIKENPILRGKLSMLGREFVIENFDEKVCARIVLDSYETALKNNS